jgi:protein-disulfide isomerase-like protein with CxxC motif
LILSERCGWCHKYYDEKWEEHSKAVQADFPSLQIITYWSGTDSHRDDVFSAFEIKSFPTLVFVNDQEFSTLGAGGDYPALQKFIKAGMKQL